MLEKSLILCAFPCIITITGKDKFPRSIERSEDTDEMARDEARHGKAFEGLLKRYFG